MSRRSLEINTASFKGWVFETTYGTFNAVIKGDFTILGTPRLKVTPFHSQKEAHLYLISSFLGEKVPRNLTCPHCDMEIKNEI